MNGPLGEALARHARAQPARTALSTLDRATVTYGALPARVEAVGARLRALGGPVGMLAENGLAWALADLAALHAGVPLVPLPGFFHDDQLRHVIATAGLCAVLADDRARLDGLLPGATPRPPLAGLALGVIEPPRNASPAPAGAHAGSRLAPASDAARGRGAIPDGVAKVTFTSGTTGRPKGVCLRGDDLQQVAASLQGIVRMVPGERHLTALPLSILLENVGGLYLPLLAGAEVVLAPSAACGIANACRVDAPRLLDALERTRSATAILVPQMLEELVAALAADRSRALPALRFAGVGGAPVGRDLLARARAAGLPVFEGYGMSEAGSVIALDAPHDPAPGTVGRPLPHLRVRVAADGEILVRTPHPPRYLGAEPAPVPDADGYWPTGDLGALDAAGRLVVGGRRGEHVITSWGRNVSPAWVEAELLTEPAIARARVCGDGERALHAQLEAAAGREREIDAAVARVNARLPAYAQVAAVRGVGAHPMGFYQTLCDATRADQDALMQIPFVRAALDGDLTRAEYVAFLTQAYHHVSQTVPLFMAAGSRLPPRHHRLQEAIAEYIRGEIGHERWILDDVAAAGGDPDAVRAGEPGRACDLLVAYAWDTVLRRAPVGLFGMVHVLEGTSVRGASRAAQALQARLGLPAAAFTYLSSHGALDVDHVAFLGGLMDGLDDPEDQRAVLRCAHRVFGLYGDVFRALPCRGARAGADVAVPS